MLFSSDRRDFLKGLVSGAAALSLSRTGFALRGDLPITATRLTDNLTLVDAAGGNGVVLNTADGLLLVNGTLAAGTDDFLALLKDPFKWQRVAAVFSTDWHLEHTGSTQAFRRAGGRVIAHENTKLWIGADFYSDWETKRYKPRPQDALPTETF